MQLLTFTVAGQDYAIESRRVIEVLPLVPARPIPHSPDYLRGIFTYRGGFVPLVDLGLRFAGRPPAERLSTRVIVVECVPMGAADRGPVWLGLVAENVISIRSGDGVDAELPGLELPGAPYLGRMIRLDGRTVQLLRIELLLPADVAAGLFPAANPTRPA